MPKGIAPTKHPTPTIEVIDDEDKIKDRLRKGLGLEEPILQSMREERRGEDLPQPNNKKNDPPDKKSVRFSSKLKHKAPIEKTNSPRKKSQKHEQSSHNDGLINALHEVTQRHVCRRDKGHGPII
jgi:hypothetical protein